MRPIVALTALAISLLLVSPLLPRIAVAQPAQGNWVVTGTQVVQNESITLNGNLTIESGGNLTLQGSSLTLNVRRNGQYGIFVQPGGDLYIRSSMIGSSDGVHRFVFQVAGNSFVMENSTLRDAGWCDIQSDLGWLCSGQSSVFNGYQGLEVNANDAVIQNDTILGSGIGITLGGSNDIVRNNVVTASNASSLVLTYGLGGSDSFTNDTVAGNEFNQEGLLNTGMITIDSSGNEVENNSLDYHLISNGQSPTGIADGGWANTIENNSIDATLGILLGNGVSDDTVSHNKITFCAQGIWTWQSGSENLIASNTLIPGNIDACNGMYQLIGMQFSGIRDSIIQGNLFYEPSTVLANPKLNPGYQLYMAQAYHSQILDNNFTFSGPQPSLYVVDSADNSVEGNVFSSTRSAAWANVYFDTSNNNTISDNSFNGAVNSTYSIVLDHSDFNAVYNNNFIGTGDLAYDGGNGNAWSLGGIGNFWSAYTGTGTYRIPPNGTDDHPLSTPVTISPVPMGKQSPTPMPSAYAGPQCYFSISNTTTISDKSLTCPAGNVEIKSGGHLTYFNGSFVFGIAGPFGFQVDSGATLSVVNSTVLWGDEGNGYQNIAAGGSFTILGSKFTITGSSPVPLVFQGGGNITIERSSIRTAQGSTGFDFRGQGNGSIDVIDSLLQGGSTFDDGIVMIGEGVIQPTDHPSVIVENSTIQDSPAGIAISGQDAVLTIMNDTFKGVDQPIGVAMVGTATVTQSLFYSSTEGVQIIAPNVSVSYNTLLRSWQGGFSVECGDGSAATCNYAGNIVGNNIINTAGPLSVLANDSVIANNVATGGLVVGGDGNSVTGNNVTSISVMGTGNIIYHNNIGSGGVGKVSVPNGNAWSLNGEGNYWAQYSGGDPDLDGVGDAPFSSNGITDHSPLMRPNGWLIMFYLTVDTNLPPSTQFAINGSTFTIGNGGSLEIRLGYISSYVISLPKSVPLSNGSSLAFVKWRNGSASPTRILSLSSNSTISATYVLKAGSITTTTSISQTKSQSSTTSGSSTSSVVPFQPLAAAVVTSLVVASYLLARRRR